MTGKGPRREPSEPRLAWIDGEFVEWDHAVIHVDTQCVLGGLNAYEMIGGFWSEDDELRLFRAKDHLRRLRLSTEMMRLPLDYSEDRLLEVACELCQRNEFREDVGVRVVAYLGIGRLFGYTRDEITTGLFMVAKPIDPEDPARGIHVSTGSWTRLADTAAPPRLKAGANYHNVRLAQVQARVDGYDDVILLNPLGKATELPIANLFVVRDGVLVTPNVTSGILEGITRSTILELASGLRIPVIEREVDRSELYATDEAFSSTTLVGLTPILSVDRHLVGNGQCGPITARLQTALERVIRGGAGHANWLTPVHAEMKHDRAAGPRGARSPSGRN